MKTRSRKTSAKEDDDSEEYVESSASVFPKETQLKGTNTFTQIGIFISYLVPPKPKPAFSKGTAAKKVLDSTVDDSIASAYPETPGSGLGSELRDISSPDTPQTKNKPPKVVPRNRSVDDAENTNKVYADDFVVPISLPVGQQTLDKFLRPKPPPIPSVTNNVFSEEKGTSDAYIVRMQKLYMKEIDDLTSKNTLLLESLHNEQAKRMRLQVHYDAQQQKYVSTVH